MLVPRVSWSHYTPIYYCTCSRLNSSCFWLSSCKWVGTTARRFCCMRYSHFVCSCLPSHWRLYSFSHRPCSLLPSMHKYKNVLVEVMRVFYTLLFILHQPRELVFLQWNLFCKKIKLQDLKGQYSRFLVQIHNSK